MESHQEGNYVATRVIKAVPTEVVVSVQKEQDRKRRYEKNHNRKKLGQGSRNKVENKDRPFIMWDGEGPQDAGYALFGNSSGYELCHPYLCTTECLDLILDCEQDIPAAIHIWYGSNYDVSMILKDLSWKHL